MDCRSCRIGAVAVQLQDARTPLDERDGARRVVDRARESIRLIMPGNRQARVGPRVGERTRGSIADIGSVVAESGEGEALSVEVESAGVVDDEVNRGDAAWKADHRSAGQAGGAGERERAFVHHEIAQGGVGGRVHQVTGTIDEEATLAELSEIGGLDAGGDDAVAGLTATHEDEGLRQSGGASAEAQGERSDATDDGRGSRAVEDQAAIIDLQDVGRVGAVDIGICPQREDVERVRDGGRTDGRDRRDISQNSGQGIRGQGGDASARIELQTSRRGAGIAGEIGVTRTGLKNDHARYRELAVGDSRSGASDGELDLITGGQGQRGPGGESILAERNRIRRVIDGTDGRAAEDARTADRHAGAEASHAGHGYRGRRCRGSSISQGDDGARRVGRARRDRHVGVGADCEGVGGVIN